MAPGLSLRFVTSDPLLRRGEGGVTAGSGAAEIHGGPTAALARNVVGVCANGSVLWDINK